MGERTTQTAARPMKLATSQVIRLAVRRLSIKYTVPCARGAPPRSAPVMYQARKIASCQPNNVVSDSVAVPNA